MILAAACAHPPELRGRSLLCDRDLDCPEPLRCFDGLCVDDEPPRLAALPTDLVVTVGEAITVTATATDLEADPLTFTWTQLAGPGPLLFDGALTDPTLTVSPQAPGLHWFAVTVTDPYTDLSTLAPASTATITILARLRGTTVYVSDLATGDDPGCGDYLSPCRTIARGLDQLHGRGVAGQILLAAASRSAGYAECLDLDGSDVLLGCFDPSTWTADPALLARCRIDCADPVGHRVQGDAALAQVTLAMAPGTPAAATTALGLSALATAFVGPGSAPRLERAVIEAPACGNGCESIGLLSVDAAPTLNGVTVFPAVVGFDPISRFVGLALIGGAPVVDAGDDGSVTTIYLNAPATDSSIGVRAVRSAASLHRLAVKGGIGPRLVGAQIYGGAATVADSVVELSGFGSRWIAGLTSLVCEPADPACACDAELERRAACPAAPTTPEVPHTTLRYNDVQLTGPVGEAGLTPCVGLGIGIQGKMGGNVVVDNRVTVADNFNLGVGTHVGVGSEAAPPPGSGASANRIAGNVVTIGEASLDPWCETAAIPAEVLLQSHHRTGSTGVDLSGDVGTQIHDNEIHVGGNGFYSGGMLAMGGTALDIEGNLFEVTPGVVGTSQPYASGVWLQSPRTIDPPAGERPADLGRFGRNVVRVSAAAAQTFALAIVDNTHWRVSNNFLHGGLGLDSFGLWIASGGWPSPSAGPSPWPEIIHNTIVGGGAGRLATISRAVRFEVKTANGGPQNAGVFENNLLDAGAGQSRRFLLDNLPGQSVPTAARGNLAQFSGASFGPIPLTAVGAPLSGYSLISWRVVIPGLSALVRFFQSYDSAPPYALGDAEEVFYSSIYGAPSAAWQCPTNGEAVVVLPLGVGLHLNPGLSELTFAAARTVDPAGVHRLQQPYRAVAGQLAGVAESPLDVAFTVRATGPFARDGGAYLMVNGSTVAAPAVPIANPAQASPFADPSLIAVGPNRTPSPVIHDINDLVILDGHLLYPVDAGWLLDPIDLSTVRRDLAGGGTEAVTLDRVALLDLVTIVKAGHQDLVLVADGRIFVFFLGTTLSDLGNALPAAAAFEAEPCAATGVTAFTRADAVDPVMVTDTTYELWVGCGDGSLELWNYVTPRFVRTTTIPGTVPEPAIGLASVKLGANDDVVLALRQGRAALEVHRYHLGTIADTRTTAIAADIAMRDGTTFTADFAPLGPEPGLTIPAQPCALAREHDGNPFDLHLWCADSPCANPCIDTGAVLAEPMADDIDEAATRRDGLPDVGADEAP
ncbi:MAG: hypothetical protein HY903_03315 [Deltaproteobacteria bacterium]|nr:hypothetical protein [Deltaproteobacteria bacterium]